MPAVGQYDVERSRNFVQSTQPVYTVPKSKQVDLKQKSQLLLPDIGQYENTDKAFTQIYRPYAKQSWSLP